MGMEHEELKLAQREQALIQELIKTKQEQKQELEFESFEGYELPPRTQFSMLKKPAVSIKYGKMTFNMACIRLFEGIQYILPLVNIAKKRLAVAMCVEEESASVEWARFKKTRSGSTRTLLQWTSLRRSIRRWGGVGSAAIRFWAGWRTRTVV